MELIRIQNLSFRYPEEESFALEDLSLFIEKGAFVTLCGPSGGGKTTLLRLLKPALSPHGEKNGEILFDGGPLEALTARDQAERIGFVLQSPENQIVTDKVWHELAFGLENLGVESHKIRLRVAEMASFFGIEDWFYKDTAALSGGQKQLLNLAGVMAMEPEILLLDEPTSQLDPMAAGSFFAALGRLHREMGVTILLTEHRLEEALQYTQTLAMIEGGRIQAAGEVGEVFQALASKKHPMVAAMPSPVRIWAGLSLKAPCPLTMGEGRQLLTDLAKTRPPREIREEKPSEKPPAISFRQVRFRYEKDGPQVLQGLNFTVAQGEITALLGGNGAGKTTLLSLTMGLHRPQSGRIHYPLQGEGKRQKPEPGHIALLPQSPQALFLHKTLELDFLDMLAHSPESQSEKQAAITEMARRFAIEDLLLRHPFDLSGGQLQKAALCKVLLRRPQILLLDEPTKGMDAGYKESLGRLLEGLAQEGLTILLVSHDVEFCAQYAKTAALLFQGQVMTQAPRRAFFSGNRFYTTAANRMARHLLPLAITVEEVIEAWPEEE